MLYWTPDFCHCSRLSLFFVYSNVICVRKNSKWLTAKNYTDCVLDLYLVRTVGIHINRRHTSSSAGTRRHCAVYCAAVMLFLVYRVFHYEFHWVACHRTNSDTVLNFSSLSFLIQFFLQIKYRQCLNDWSCFLFISD